MCGNDCIYIYIYYLFIENIATYAPVVFISFASGHISTRSQKIYGQKTPLHTFEMR